MRDKQYTFETEAQAIAFIRYLVEYAGELPHREGCTVFNLSNRRVQAAVAFKVGFNAGLTQESLTPYNCIATLYSPPDNPV